MNRRPLVRIALVGLLLSQTEIASAESPKAPTVPSPAAASPVQLRRSQELVKQFDEIERRDVGAMWHCLNYGVMKAEDVKGHEETILLNVTSRLERDSIGYLDLVRSRCVPLGFLAAEKVAALQATPELSAALDAYRRSLTALSTTLKSWARPLPDDADRADDLQIFRRAYQHWAGTRDGRNADAQAWQYDQFLRCAAADPDLLKDPARLYSFLWEMSAVSIGSKHLDQPFFRRLRTTCLPGLRVVPTRMPPEFEQTHQRLSAAIPPIGLWEMCFQRMLMLFRGETLVTLHRAWKDWNAASEQVRASQLVPTAENKERLTVPAVPLTAQEQSRRAAFTKKFTAFEERDVEAMWACLFGPQTEERLWPRFALRLALDSEHHRDPRGFPGKVLKACVPLGLQVAQKVPGLSPPAAFATAIKGYDKALRDMMAAIKQWAEQAPLRTESILDKQALQQAGQAWSDRTDPKRVAPSAWQYDRFLRCALPDLDQMQNSDAVLKALARGCPRTQRGSTEAGKTFLKLLRATCLPQVRVPLDRSAENFEATRQNLAPAYFELRNVLDRCLSAADDLDTPDGSDPTNSAGADWQQAGSAVRQLGSEASTARP